MIMVREMAFKFYIKKYILVYVMKLEETQSTHFEYLNILCKPLGGISIVRIYEIYLLLMVMKAKHSFYSATNEMHLESVHRMQTQRYRC